MKYTIIIQKKNKEKLLLYIHKNMYIYIKISKQIIEIYSFSRIFIRIYINFTNNKVCHIAIDHVLYAMIDQPKMLVYGHIDKELEL